MYGRREEEIIVHNLAPWGEAETQAYLDSLDKKGNAAQIAKVADGRPGFIGELVGILTDAGQLEQDLSEATLGQFVPMAVDESELSIPDAPAEEGKPKHATKDDAPQIAYLAALLGQAFPSAIVADMGGYDRESIDDLLDAMSGNNGLFEEVQFSKDLGTWIYRFTRGSWREGVLQANATEEGTELARKAGMFMERYLVPRGAGFITKTARIYAANGVSERASMLRAMALSQDAADVWGLCFDVVKYFDEVEWPDALVRTLYMNLLDNLVGSGPVPAAEQIHQDATEWAGERQDKDMTAWLCFIGSRLDARRQDFYRAKDRAEDALKLYTALENKQKVAEVHNHLATIHLQDGKPEEAIKQVNLAVEAGQIDGPDGQKVLTPPVFAHAEQIRGLIARRGGDPKQAIQHFRNANEAAGRAGIAILALDSGLAFGEALLASGEVAQAQEALERVVEIARQLKNPMRERNACELAAQAQGATRNWEKAIQYAGRTLELTQGLKFTQAMPVDLHNLGFFLLASGKVKEALPYLSQAESGLAGLGNHPVVKECLYFSGMAKAQTGDLDGAKKSFTNALPHLEGHKDWPKFIAAKSNLAGIAAQGGDKATAKTLMQEAIATADSHGLKNEKKELKKRLASLA
jgi:tetratricopeptide (TPR) repeat protein